MKAASWFFLLTLTLLFSPDVMAKKFASGSWTGKTHYSKKNGEFVRCGMWASYKSGNRLGLSINHNGIFEVWVSNSDWSLTVGKKYDVSYHVDNYRRYAGEAEILSKNAMMLPASKSQSLYKQIRRGYKLFIQTPGDELRFSLKGTSAALLKLKRCFDQADTKVATSKNPFEAKAQNRTTSASKNPFEAKAQNRTTSASASEKTQSSKKNNSIGFVKGILSLIKGVDIDIVDEVPEAFDAMKPDLVWQAVDTWGFSNFVPMKISKKTVSKLLAKEDKKSCKGEFATITQERRFTNRPNYKSFVVKNACTDDGKGFPFYNVYSFYTLKNGGMVRIAHSSLSPETAPMIDTKFFEVIDKILD
jgi:hypothetical protein